MSDTGDCTANKYTLLQHGRRCQHFTAFKAYMISPSTKMERLTLILLLFIAHLSSLSAQAPRPQVEYTPKDSLEVVQLLADQSLQSPLDFARRLCGRPYVAHTLERGDEHLVVNLRELDCATLVETASALAIARRQLDRMQRAPLRNGPQHADNDSIARKPQDAHSPTYHPWEAFCRALESIRYRNGHCNGYLSRLHYLSFWIDDHKRRGNIVEVQLPAKLTKMQRTDIHYMSRHASKYPGLKSPEDVRRIAALEAQQTGQTFAYLPQEACGLPKSELQDIHDGDIICIVTTLDGLDYSHQGLAFWDNDGKLHLLHASSAKGKVIADTRPLDTYLKGIKTSIGIRVLRIQTPTRNARQMPQRPARQKQGEDK